MKPVFFDTSVLIAGLVELRPAGDPAQQVMEAVAEKHMARPHTAWHCCLEFFAVSTRLPEEFRLAPADALRLVKEEILARFEVHQLSREDHVSFFQSVERDRAVGGRIYDAHIAEIARLAKVGTVVTDNGRHFSALSRHGIRVLSAAELAAEL